MLPRPQLELHQQEYPDSLGGHSGTKAVLVEEGRAWFPTSRETCVALAKEVLNQIWNGLTSLLFASVPVDCCTEELSRDAVCMDKEYAPAVVGVHGASEVSIDCHNVYEHYESTVLQGRKTTDACLWHCYGKVYLGAVLPFRQTFSEDAILVLPVVGCQSSRRHFRNRADGSVCRFVRRNDSPSKD